MRQSIKITGYHVPWHLTDNKRAIFSTISNRDAFLDVFSVGYEKTYAGSDFHPDQESIVLSPPQYSVEQIDLIKTINYIRVELFAVHDEHPQSDKKYAEYFYFITNNPVPPISEEFPYANHGTITARIKRDAWLSFVYPSNNTFINSGTIINQSTPLTPKTQGIFDETNKNDCVDLLSAGLPFGGIPLSENGRNLTYTFVGKGTDASGGNFGALKPDENYTEDDAFYFVGIFGSEYSGVLVLCRPIDLYKSGIDDENSVATLGTLLHVNKIRPCRVKKDGYVDDESGAVSGDAFNVNLLRAYIIPKKALQKTSVDNAARLGLGFEIMSTSDLGSYPFQTAFSVVNVEETAFFESAISFDVETATPFSFESLGHPVFVDIGTETTRLQVEPPTQSNAVSISFTAQATNAGYSLIMSVGNRRLDLGGDFEIPVPDNPEAEAFARNKWSIALQGVSHAGGLVAAFATKNPVAIVGATVSAGQFFANVSEQQSVPATIQGQGNGLFTYGTAKLKTISGDTRGAVYCRYLFQTSNERKEAERWGYKWARAWVDDTSAASVAIFGNGVETKTGRAFIKTSGCGISFSPFSEDPESDEGTFVEAVPDEAVEEIQELFNNGVFIYYDPETSGGFGA